MTSHVTGNRGIQGVESVETEASAGGAVKMKAAALRVTKSGVGWGGAVGVGGECAHKP